MDVHADTKCHLGLLEKHSFKVPAGSCPTHFYINPIENAATCIDSALVVIFILDSHRGVAAGLGTLW